MMNTIDAKFGPNLSQRCLLFGNVFLGGMIAFTVWLMLLVSVKSGQPVAVFELAIVVAIALVAMLGVLAVQFSWKRGGLLSTTASKPRFTVFISIAHPSKNALPSYLCNAFPQLKKIVVGFCKIVLVPALVQAALKMLRDLLDGK